MFPSYMHGHFDNIFLFQHYNCSVFNIFTNRHFIVYLCKNIFILNLKISNGGFGYFKVSESTVIIIMKLFHFVLFHIVPTAFVWKHFVPDGITVCQSNTCKETWQKKFKIIRSRLFIFWFFWHEYDPVY